MLHRHDFIDLDFKHILLPYNLQASDALSKPTIQSQRNSQRFKGRASKDGLSDPCRKSQSPLHQAPTGYIDNNLSQPNDVAPHLHNLLQLKGLLEGLQSCHEAIYSPTHVPDGCEILLLPPHRFHHLLVPLILEDCLLESQLQELSFHVKHLAFSEDPVSQTIDKEVAQFTYLVPSPNAVCTQLGLLAP